MREKSAVHRDGVARAGGADAIVLVLISLSIEIAVEYRFKSLHFVMMASCLHHEGVIMTLRCA